LRVRRATPRFARFPATPLGDDAEILLIPLRLKSRLGRHLRVFMRDQTLHAGLAADPVTHAAALRICGKRKVAR
jgi:hypothetical protein